MTRFVRLPPGRRNVLVPVGSRRTARCGIALLTMSKPVALAAQWLLYAGVTVAGPRLLPGERTGWTPPLEPTDWRGLTERLTTELSPFDAMAIYERPQASRSGVAALLLHAGNPIGFLKVRGDHEALGRERAALNAIPRGATARFRVPRVLAHGEIAGRSWTVLEAMPPRPARPAGRPPLDAIINELRPPLAKASPRAEHVPEHWQPMHGDLTPWNLRRCGRGLPWLIDWEDSGWGPPGADRIYYDAIYSAVFRRPPKDRRPPRNEATAEAAEFWLERVRDRSESDHDADLNARLLTVLRRWT